MTPISANPSATEWKTSLGRWMEYPATVAPNGDVFVGSLQHRVCSLDPQSGAVRWRAELSEPLREAPQCLTPDTLLVASTQTESLGGTPLPEITSRQTLVALDAADGHQKWQTRLEPRSGAVTAPDGNLYVQSPQALARLDRSSGQVQWQAKVDSTYWSPSFAADGSVYHVERQQGDAQRLVRHDAASGAEQWGFLGGNLEYGLRLGSSGQVGVESRKLGPNGTLAANCFHLLDRGSGVPTWTRSFDQESYRASFLGDKVLFERGQWSSPTAQLEAVDAASGQTLWTTTLPSLSHTVQGPAGELLAFTYQRGPRGAMHAFSCHRVDPSSGRVMWTLTEPDPSRGLDFRQWSSGGDLYLTARHDDGNTVRTQLLRVDAATGQTQWRYDAGKGVRQVIPDGEQVYAQVGEYKVVCLDRDHGLARWHYQSGEQLLVSPQVQNGHLVVSDLNSNVAALTAASTLAVPGDSPSRGDAAHDGPVIIRGTSQFPLLDNARKQVLGEDKPILYADFDYSGKYEGWDYVVVADRNRDGRITDEDLKELPTAESMRALADADGIIAGEAARQFYLWRDVDGDGHISNDDFIMPAAQGPHGAGLIDVPGKALYSRFTSGDT